VTFSYIDPETREQDAVRFLLGDTDSNEPLLSDEEISYALNKWMTIHGTVEYTASVLALNIAARYAREASVSADGVSVQLGQVANQFRDLAASLREQHKNLLVGGVPDVGGVSPYEQLDPDTKNFAFGTGMHDDIEAGNQDQGSRQIFWPPEYYPGL
jgi:hypothetical protein